MKSKSYSEDIIKRMSNAILNRIMGSCIVCNKRVEFYVCERCWNRNSVRDMWDEAVKRSAMIKRMKV